MERYEARERANHILSGWNEKPSVESVIDLLMKVNELEREIIAHKEDVDDKQRRYNTVIEELKSKPRVLSVEEIHKILWDNNKVTWTHGDMTTAKAIHEAQTKIMGGVT